jgi:hypothetical protein
LDELDDFAQMFGKATADKAAGAASKATGAGNRGATR